MVAPALDIISSARHGFPFTGTPGEKLAALVRYAVLAPSGHNTQPWRFRIVGDALRVVADRTRSLRVVDPRDRELIMSCGAALFHLRVALRHYGYQGEVDILPDPADGDVLAEVRLGAYRSPSVEDEELYLAIPLRRTHRGRFDDRPVRAVMLEMLRAEAAREGAWLATIEGTERRAAAAELIATGEQRRGASPGYRLELARWIRANDSRSRDGVPGWAFGIPDFVSRAAPFVVSVAPWGRIIARHDQELAQNAPALIVLGTERDDVAAWIAAGQALAAVLLRATALDLSASFLNQPMADPELRGKLTALLRRDGFPQLMLRVGYGWLTRATPRRPLSAVLE